MGVIDVFSTRDENPPDVFVYDSLPQPLRNQIALIWEDAIDKPLSGVIRWGDQSDEFWGAVEKIIAKEHGLLSLGGGTPREACRRYLLSETNAKKALSIVEFAFRAIAAFSRNSPGRVHGGQSPADAIEELNARFRQHGIGYRYEAGRIIRVDSEFLHAEVVRSALRLLQDPGFSGPEKEFLNAHEHYRNGKIDEAITEALKAFESTMKAICGARGWTFKPTDTASGLIDVVFANGLILPALLSHFTGLRTTLESGLPTVRNKLGGHGDGAEPVHVPPYVAAYAIHLAAANIVLLVEAHRAMPK